MTVRRDQLYREQPSLFDDLSSMVVERQAVSQQVPPKSTEQQRQLARVSTSIGAVIVDFFKSKKPGDLFFASELHQFVADRASIAPSSADRVMRDLRQSGEIYYSLVSRSQSQYRVESSVA